MPRPPTSPGRRSPLQGLGLGPAHPTMTAPTLSPLFGETRYPSLPREGATSRQSHLGSGQTSPIKDDDDNEAPAPLVLGSRNPFLALITARRQTLSTGKGLTSSGTPLEQIDQDMLGPEQVEAWELRRADVEARTSWHHAGTCEDMEYFLAINRGALFHFRHPTDGELMARIHANRNWELFRPHPGHRRPDLRAGTEEEERLLREQLERLALQLNERLWGEDNTH